MGEFTSEFQSSHEYDTPHVTLDLFLAENCDPDRDVIRLVNGEVTRFSNTLFHGTTGDKVIMLRSGLKEEKLIYWLGTYDTTLKKSTEYDVSDEVIISDNPRLGAAGAFSKMAIYEAKAHDSSGETVHLHFSGQSIEWVEGNDKQPIEMIALSN
jgi:hypothetical protein